LTVQLLTREQVHNDDISQVLILNKKSISNYETQLFQAELEKFRPHQSRLLSANHKQSSLMKELTATFNALLQDKRVRAEQSKYESITRQRSSVMSKYKRIYQEFLDLVAGLQSAKQWYSEMKDTVDSLDKNVETFVNNRRSEGAQLLGQIEQDRAANASGQADRERERLRGLMERMSMDPSTSPSSGRQPRAQSVAYTSSYPSTNFAGQYQVPTSPQQHPQSAHPAYAPPQNGSFFPTQQQKRPETHSSHKPAPLAAAPSYNPGTYPPVSPPPNQTTFSQSFNRPVQHTSINQQFVPHGYVPPPPPPGPPPLGPQQTFPQAGEYGYANPAAQQRGGPQQSSGDPWAGLNAWK
jgi:hypothetical protein